MTITPIRADAQETARHPGRQAHPASATSSTPASAPGVVNTPMNAVPADVPGRVRPVTSVLDDFAERIIATAAARRSTWSHWNVHAEAERLLCAEVPSLPPDQQPDLAERLVTLACPPSQATWTVSLRS